MIISSLLASRGSNSQFGNVRSGVAQGPVLGPLVFLVFINYVLEKISCRARLFADDCILYAEVNNVQDQVNLNSCLKKVEEWCNEWQMILNTEKTVCMTVTHKRDVYCIVVYVMKIYWNVLGAISTCVLQLLTISVGTLTLTILSRRQMQNLIF